MSRSKTKTTTEVNLPRPGTARVCDLKPSPHNARTHSKRQIEQIARSIKRYKFTNPVIIDESNNVLAGHARVAAAALLKVESIPVLRVDYFSEAEKRGYMLADNKTALNADWDREILSSELEALIELEFDMELTGFDTAEIDLITDDVAEAIRRLSPLLLSLI